MITVKYLRSKLNIKADWESGNAESSSEWKLLPEVFQVIGKNFVQATIDLFISRLCH